MLKLKTYTKTKYKLKPTFTLKNCSCVVHIAEHNTAQNSSDNFLSYPPDNHHGSDDVYWRRGANIQLHQIQRGLALINYLSSPHPSHLMLLLQNFLFNGWDR